MIAIVGPTASGKSALAMRVAERLGGEIVSADSRQVYRAMDIGTAKPTATERARIPHHLVDVVDPGERYDVPIAELFALAESEPADTGNYRSRILSVQQTGDAAVGVVAEEGYWGSVSFIDYFLLARIEGAWKIVCKLFAHTGGEPPEGV